MKRRPLLRISVVGLGIGIGGCLETSFTGNDGNDTPDVAMVGDTDDGNNDNMDMTNNDNNRIRNVQFEVIDVTGSEFELSSTIVFGIHRINVSGTISGNNSCYSARLGQTSFMGGTLTIEIESFDDASEDEGCLEILVGISYEAIIEFEDGLAEKVVVLHNGEKMTSAHQR